MIKIIMIACGGFLGAILRYEVKNILHLATFPIATLLVNTIGCFLLAFAATYYTRKENEFIKLGITTGLCGALTTFSTLCKESVQFIMNRQYAQAFVYLLLLFILGISAVHFGEEFAKSIVYKKIEKFVEASSIENTEDEVE